MTGSTRPDRAPARRRRLLLAALLLTLGLAACSPPTPVPQPEGLLAPKQLATVILSPTPVATLVVPPTATRQPSATPSPIPPTPTATQTPYVGVFMGDGSLPLVMPTSPFSPLVDVTLIPPTPLGGENAVVFATATPFLVQPYGTLDPALVGAAVTGCATQLAGVFGGPYAANPGVAQALGCPTGAPEQPSMAEQSFERGLMIWMPGQIYALATESVDGQSRVYWPLQDLWQEGMPADDPQMTVPDGRLQPIRGFGLAWRTSQPVRNALGWATVSEEGYTGTLQRFERGLMLTTRTGAVYALVPDATGARGQYTGPLF